jgi:hypothetical protein
MMDNLYARCVFFVKDAEQSLRFYKEQLGFSEDWRPDAKQFPSSVLGRTNGWPGERWLDMDIRQTNVLAPIITARFQMCKDKGFDAIEADNVNGRNLNVRATLELSDQRVAFLGSVL